MKTTSPYRSSDISPHSAAAFRHRVSQSRKTRHWFAAVTLIAALTGTAPAQMPQLINYQGRITVEGVNFGGTGQFKFAMVDVVKWCNARSEMEGLTPCYYTNTAQTTI